MSDTPKGVGDDDPLLDGPVEGPLDDADDGGAGPIGLPFDVGVEPAGQMDRQALRNQTESVSFGESL
jgi:hypothetical protein